MSCKDAGVLRPKNQNAAPESDEAQRRVLIDQVTADLADAAVAQTLLDEAASAERVLAARPAPVTPEEAVAALEAATERVKRALAARGGA